MNNNQSDHDLWRKVKSGDEHAFKALFDKYYKSLTYRAYKIYPDQHLAKDKVQEVFLDLWKKRETREIHTSVHAFLSKAVVFKTIDYIRGKRLDFDAELELERPFDPEEEDCTELKQLIHKTVKKLPERCRVVFSMSRFEDMSHKEIAEQLSISTKTVENQITKALKILRRNVKLYLSDDMLLAILFLKWIGDWSLTADIIRNAIA